MAKSYEGNPQWIHGLAEEQKGLAVANQTWKAGQLGQVDANGVIKLLASSASTAEPCHVVLTRDQTTSTTASSSVWYARLQSNNQCEIALCNGDADATGPQTVIGDNLGLHVGGNTVSLNTADSTNAVMHVERRVCDTDPYKHASTDSPAWVVASVLDANRTAAGT